jgi:hypothetical protein
LSCIDQLPEADRVNLETMEPKLRTIYNLRGGWREIIASIVGFDDSLDNHIRSLWDQNSSLAVAHGEKLLAEDFAQMVVDENFSDI